MRHSHHGKLTDEVTQNTLAQCTGYVFHGWGDVEKIPFLEELIPCLRQGLAAQYQDLVAEPA